MSIVTDPVWKKSSSCPPTTETVAIPEALGSPDAPGFDDNDWVIVEDSPMGGGEAPVRLPPGLAKKEDRIDVVAGAMNAAEPTLGAGRKAKKLKIKKPPVPGWTNVSVRASQGGNPKTRVTYDASAIPATSDTGDTATIDFDLDMVPTQYNYIAASDGLTQLEMIQGIADEMNTNILAGYDDEVYFALPDSLEYGAKTPPAYVLDNVVITWVAA